MSERFNILERDECIGEVVVVKSTGENSATVLMAEL